MNNMNLFHLLKATVEDLELEYQREPSAELRQQIDDILARMQELKDSQQ
jgi:hypothetical protein